MLSGRADVKYIRLALLRQLQRYQGEPITLDRLADVLQCGKSTAIRHRDALQAQGLITFEERRGRDTGGSIYELTHEGKEAIEANVW